MNINSNNFTVDFKCDIVVKISSRFCGWIESTFYVYLPFILHQFVARDAIRNSPSNDISQAVTIHNSLSTNAIASVNTFTIVNSPFLIAQPSEVIETSLSLCLARKRAETYTQFSVCAAILKYTTLKNFFPYRHSRIASCELNKSLIITANNQNCK